MWHSTAQQQHSIAQYSRGGACWVLTTPVCRVFFLHTPASRVWIGECSGFCFRKIFEHPFAAGLVSWVSWRWSALCLCVVGSLAGLVTA
jgi:hypothetical protein